MQLDEVHVSGSADRVDEYMSSYADEPMGAGLTNEDSRMIALEDFTRDALLRFAQQGKETTFSPAKLRSVMVAARETFGELFDTYVQNGGSDSIEAYLESRIAQDFPEKPAFVLDLFLALIRTDMCDRLMAVLGEGFVQTAATEGRVNINKDEIAHVFARLLPDVLEKRTQRLLEKIKGEENPAA